MRNRPLIISGTLLATAFALYLSLARSGSALDPEQVGASVGVDAPALAQRPRVRPPAPGPHASGSVGEVPPGAVVAVAPGGGQRGQSQDPLEGPRRLEKSRRLLERASAWLDERRSQALAEDRAEAVAQLTLRRERLALRLRVLQAAKDPDQEVTSNAAEH